jgi:DNA replication protein DnaC
MSNAAHQTGELETLGADYEGRGLIEILGPAPCPTDGCNNAGEKVRVLRLVITNPCPPCYDRLEAARVEQERQEQAAKLLSRAGGSPRLMDVSLATHPDDPPGRATRQAVGRWVTTVLESTSAQPAPNFVLYGGVGSGKTCAAWGAVRVFCAKLVEARLIDFPDLLEQIRQSYAKHVPLDTYTDLMRVPVLALDDLGAERPTEWACGQLLQLVNKRYERKLPTMYVSNYEPGVLAERLGRDDPVVGERIVSRMVQGAMQHRDLSPDRRS